MHWITHKYTDKLYEEHFPDKHSIGNNWVRYQRKRIKAGTMPEEQKRLFEELAASRSDAHTGGRKDDNTENK